jgi:hypothetical protein
MVPIDSAAFDPKQRNAVAVWHAFHAKSNNKTADAFF